MNAKYAGTCQCGATFGKGATINYDRGIRKVTACPTCKPSSAALAPRWDTGRPNPRYTPDASDTAYEDQCAARCGLGGRD